MPLCQTILMMKLPVQHNPPKAYLLHNLALAPALLGQISFKEVAEKIGRMSEQEQQAFWQFIIEQGLACHWYLYIKGMGIEADWKEEVQSRFRLHAFKTSANHLLQKRVLLDIDALLVNADIPYVILKGAHVREILYPGKSLRPTADIDILILPESINQVVSLLCRSGSIAIPDSRTISNDLNLWFQGVAVDLHWDVLRPGRAREGLAQELIDNRLRFDGYYGSSVDSIVFLMLVHPVFKKYVTSPVSKITRLVDLLKIQDLYEINWENVYRLSERFGLCSACWLTATYFNMLTGSTSVPKAFVDKVKPGTIRTTYLLFWLKYNLPTLLFKTPMVIKILFTLSAHDTVSDVYRFLKTKKTLDAGLQKDMLAMQELIDSNKNKK